MYEVRTVLVSSVNVYFNRSRMKLDETKLIESVMDETKLI
jgi:precorrin-6B methylase 1